VKKSLILTSLLVLPWLASARPAWAGIEACGDIQIDAEATCTVEYEGGCELQCTPVNVEAACAAELQVDCRGECQVEADVGCEIACNVGECVAQCNIDPPSFECTADCNLRADARCNAVCQSNPNRTECNASCKATYSAECDASCQGTPGSASCEARCEASCDADCRAQASVDCQVDCQSEGYVDCKLEVEGGCEAACSRPDGALFCDGQYVDAGNNLEESIGAIEAALDITVEASGSADCEGNTCTAEGSASASCDIAEPDGRGTPIAAFSALLGTIGLMASRRRRRR
jgi:hypothetical protein